MMIFFKESIGKAKIALRVLLVLQMLVLASCLRGPSKNPKSLGDTADATGDFKLLPVEGSSVSVQENSAWTIPNEKTYQFRACLISRTTNNQLPIGQEFEIVLDNKLRKRVRTDNLGCVTWQEVVPFNYAGDSVYIERVREIVGKDVYKGKDTIRLAINPWLEFREEAGDEVVDLVRFPEKVPEGALEEASSGDAALGGLFSNLSNQHLFIESTPVLNIKNTRDLPEGKELEIIFQASPFIQTLKMNKDPHVTRLKNGEFNVYLQLVATYVGPRGKYNMILTPELKPMVDKNKAKIGPDGKLTFKGKVILNKKARGGIVQMAVKITPVNAPFDLGSYEGMHDVGEFDQLLGLKYAQQSKGIYTEEEFSYSDYLENETTNFAELKKSDWAMELPPVRYEPLVPRFVRVNGGETSTWREITFRTTTRATDSITGKPLADEKFMVTRSYDGVQVPVNATENGVIRWMDEISHLYYETEKYDFPVVGITHLASESKQDIKIAINPWDYGWTFGEDTRGNLAKFYQGLAETNVKPNTLFIDAFRYQTIRFRYEIDPYMTLNVKKAVVMAMDPLVQRTTIQNGRIFEPLRDGIYLAKVALVKYFVDPFQNGTRLSKNEDTKAHFLGRVREGGDFETGQYTTVIKKLIRVQAGRITTPLEFSMRDLRMMSIRSQIMVQLETIDEKMLLRDNIVEGKMRELYEDYLALNDPGNAVTPEQREAFFDQKEALFESEMAGLRIKMEKELEILKEQRLARGEAQAGQFEIYEQLEEAVRDIQPAALRAQYVQIMGEERADFQKKMDGFRDRLQEMHEKMEDYWETDFTERWAHLGFEDGLPPVPLRVGAPPEHNKYGATGGIERDKVLKRQGKGYGDKIKDSEVLCYDANDKQGVDEECRKRGLKFTEESVSYYDYLSVMQSFITDIGLPSTIGKSDYDAFELNNYTANPAAPFINLNLYRNRSGLKRRTFIGPCTLVANANMSEMRATDTIDEKYCEKNGIDCSEGLYQPQHPPADNEEFENAAEHDSLKPFTNMHVDEVIQMHKKNEEDYELSMMMTSQMGSYIDQFHYDFTSLNGDPSIKEFVQGCKYDGPVAQFEDSEDCFKDFDNYELKADKRRIIELDELVESLATHDEEMKRLYRKYFSIHGWNTLLTLEKPEIEESDVAGTTPFWEQAQRHLSRLQTAEYLNTKATDRWFEKDRGVGDRSDGKSARVGNYFMEEKLDGKIPGFNEENIRGWLDNGISSLNLSDALRLCAYHSRAAAERLDLAGYLKPDRVTERGGPLAQMRGTTEKHVIESQHLAYVGLLQTCLESFVYLPESEEIYLSGFSLERRWKIHETGPYKHIAGKNMNLNVGVDFGLETFNNAHDAINTGANAVSGIVAAMTGVGAIIGTGILPGPGTAAGAALGALGGFITSFAFNIVSEDVEGNAEALATSVSAATFLVVQKAEMQVDIFRHEKCVTSAFTPNLMKNINQSIGGLIKESVFRKKKTYEKYVTAVGSGIMICDGKITTTKGENAEQIFENWYYVTQHFTAGDMLDEVNLLNHVWLLALRGDRDYNKFIHSLQARPVDSHGEEIPNKSLFNYPLYRLGKIYDDVTPSFPGIYTLPD